MNNEINAIIKEHTPEELKHASAIMVRLARAALHHANDFGLIRGNEHAALAMKIFETTEDDTELLGALAEFNLPESRDTLKCPFCGEQVEFDETKYDSDGGYEKWCCPACGHYGRNIMSAPQFLKFDGLWDADGNPVSLDGVSMEAESEQGFTLADAKADVVAYLKAQDEAYFAERQRTKATVLADDELLDELTGEHYKCVTKFGNDREWSAKDACDSNPGIWADED